MWITGNVRASLAATAAIVLSQLASSVGRLARPAHGHVLVDGSAADDGAGFSYAAHRILRPSVTVTLVLCLLTTVAGFASFGWTDLKPLRAFAVNGAVGLALVWLAVVMLVPPATRASEHRRRAVWLRPLLRSAVGAATRKPAIVAAVSLVLTVAAFPLAGRIRFEHDPLAYFPTDARVVSDFRTLDARLTGMLPFQVRVEPPADARGLLESAPGVRKVIDVSAFVVRTHACTGAWRTTMPCRVSSPIRVDGRAGRRTSRHAAMAGVASQLHHVACALRGPFSRCR